MSERVPWTKSAFSLRPPTDTVKGVAPPSGGRGLISRGAPPRRLQWNSALRRWAERLILLILIATFSVKAFLPAWQHLNSDFPNYYLIARLYRAGYPLERVYDWTWLQRQKDHEGIERNHVSFIPSTLPSALAVLPVSSLPPLQAKRWWLVANLAFLLLSLLLLSRMTRMGWIRVALLAFLAFVPLRENFLLGQMHILVLLLITIAAWFYFRESPILSGMSLALAAALKIYPGVFLIYFLWRRQWRAAIGLTSGLLGVAAACLYLFGSSACLLYVRQVLPAGLRGETIDPYNTAWNSWTALLRRLFIAEPELNPFPVAHLPWLYALLQPMVHVFLLVIFLWAMGWQARKENRKVEWSVFLFLLLFLSSQPGSYHVVALIPAAVFVIDDLLARGKNISAGIVTAVYALVCGPVIHIPGTTPIGWGNLLFFSRLAFMTSLGIVLLWVILQLDRERLRERFGLRNMAVACAAFVALTIVGFVSTQRHLRGQFDNYAHRVVRILDNLFASDPALSADGILFVKMIPQGYTVERLRSGMPVEFPSQGGDLFHPTSAAGLAWAEEASRLDSRIVQLPTGNFAHAAALTVEAENAQEPSISRDGHSLAFLRNGNSRNSLWVKEIGPAVAERNTASEKEIAGQEYDVREVTWLDEQRLIFSSRRKGNFSLYQATLQGNVEELSMPSCSARYPAVSPDRRWLAFSCDQGGSWQLHVMTVEGTQERQLTDADCNSVAPAWTADSKRIIYATDCGRGLGLTALTEMSLIH
jgi:Glycosyltransferase family 87/Lipoprotein LpqB beta-propeller domain